MQGNAIAISPSQLSTLGIYGRITTFHEYSALRFKEKNPPQPGKTEFLAKP